MTYLLDVVRKREEKKYHITLDSAGIGKVASLYEQVRRLRSCLELPWMLILRMMDRF